MTNEELPEEYDFYTARGNINFERRTMTEVQAKDYAKKYKLKYAKVIKEELKG